VVLAITLIALLLRLARSPLPRPEWPVRVEQSQRRSAEAEVIGISSDLVEAHQLFAQAHQLPFIPLSNAGDAISKCYGVSTTFGLPGRATYTID
jgi:peroxiredoxin